MRAEGPELLMEQHVAAVGGSAAGPMDGIRRTVIPFLEVIASRIPMMSWNNPPMADCNDNERRA